MINDTDNLAFYSDDEILKMRDELDELDKWTYEDYDKHAIRPNKWSLVELQRELLRRDTNAGMLE